MIKILSEIYIKRDSLFIIIFRKFRNWGFPETFFPLIKISIENSFQICEPRVAGMKIIGKTCYEFLKNDDKLRYHLA